MNWRGRSLVSHEVIVALIGAILWTRVGAKSAISSATVVALVGVLQVLTALHLGHIG